MVYPIRTHYYVYTDVQLDGTLNKKKKALWCIPLMITNLKKNNIKYHDYLTLAKVDFNTSLCFPEKKW